MKLTEIKKLTGKIVLKSGLHIGGGDTDMHIGGTDSPVIKHPNTLQPYIPGSSLKGKIRSLLELSKGLINFTGGDVVSLTTLSKIQDETELKNAKNILKLFGYGASDSKENEKYGKELGCTRVLFSDCFINEEWLNNNSNASTTEIKAENSIDRQTSTAKSPRFIERVPEGIVFDFSLSIKIFEGDNQDILDILKEGLVLLEKDALGGSGSRGYGKIEFIDLKLDNENFVLNK